jgi:hypothetical protein
MRLVFEVGIVPSAVLSAFICHSRFPFESLKCVERIPISLHCFSSTIAIMYYTETP